MKQDHIWEECGKYYKKVETFPIFRDRVNRQGVIWKNVFRLDWNTVFIVGMLLLLVFAYKADISKCDEVLEKPCEFCEKSNCCEILNTPGYDSGSEYDLDIQDFNIGNS